MTSLLIICMLAGSCGAILQGMIGIGTGMIVIPLLTFLLPHYGIASDAAVHIALATSMAAIVVSSTSALISHHRRGNIKWPIFKQMIAFSLSGGLVGALAASMMAGRLLQIIFGSFMLLLALYMFIKKSPADQINTPPAIQSTSLRAGGFGIGFMGSIIGSGGGVLMVPFLRTQHLQMRYAVGTSTLVCLPVAMVGALTYIITGLMWLPWSAVTLGYLHWPAFLAIASAGFVSAPVGARLATIVPTAILQKIFASCMILVGFKMLL